MMDPASALAGCTTPADHYRVQLAIENRLAPTEAAALEAQLDSLPEPAHDWVRRVARMARRVRRRPQPYRRHELAETVSFYEGSGPAGVQRSLVIGFTGVGQRMMLPTAPFLQALPAARCDVVILRDPAFTGFLGGVPGYAEDLPGLAARLARDIPTAWHEDRRCIGVSSGAAAAVAFGTVCGAAVSLGLGGMHPTRMLLRRAPPGTDRHLFDRLRTGLPAGRGRVICAYGTACERDAANMEHFASTLPGSRLLGVQDVAQHGVLPGLFHTGTMTRFFAEVLLGAGPTGPLWQPAPAAVTPEPSHSPG